MTTSRNNLYTTEYTRDRATLDTDVHGAMFVVPGPDGPTCIELSGTVVIHLEWSPLALPAERSQHAAARIEAQHVAWQMFIGWRKARLYRWWRLVRWAWRVSGGAQ